MHSHLYRHGIRSIRGPVLAPPSTSSVGVLPSQLLDGHLLVGSQLGDLRLHRRGVVPGITLLRRDGGLVVLLAVAVEVAVAALIIMIICVYVTPREFEYINRA